MKPFSIKGKVSKIQIYFDQRYNYLQGLKFFDGDGELITEQGIC